MQYNCQGCNSIAPSQFKEPLIISKTPEYPFQYICADYFEIKGNQYLTVVDRFSSWIMIYHFLPTKLNHQSLIDTCREIFTTYGTPEGISSDGGPKFIAHQFQDFLHQWGVQTQIIITGNTLNQMAGLVSNLPNVLYMIMLHQMTH